jgi:hypothetical protein
MEAFGFSSLLKLTRDFLEKLDEVEETVVADEVVVVDRMDDRRDCDFNASRSGITISTCWQTSSEARNLGKICQL